MQERALCKVLLVQAIEETDPAGDALPLGTRAQATREAAGNGAAPATQPLAGPLTPETEAFLARRADILLGTLQARSPALERVLALAGGAGGLNQRIFLWALLLGVVLAWLDGTRRILIFSTALLVLLAWNLLVYVRGGLRLLRRQRAGGKPRTFWFGAFYARSSRARLDKLLSHSIGFNAPLTPGLRRFADEWWDLNGPGFERRARAVLHAAAALVAVGLLVGMSVRAAVLHLPAGWSGSLGSSTAHALLVALYGPASAVSGTAIPGAQALEALRWSATPPGGNAIPWLVLMVWTAALYIIVPRVLATLSAAIGLWRSSQRLAPPAALSGYARTLPGSARPEVS